MRIAIIDKSEETLSRLQKQTTAEFKISSRQPFFDVQIERALIKFQPTLILLGLYLHDGFESGFRVLRQLKRSGLKNIPVVVIEKYIDGPNHKLAKKARRLGAVAALPKLPFPEITTILNYASIKR